MPKIMPCPFCGATDPTYDPELDLVFCNACHAESGLDGRLGWNERDMMGAIHTILRHLRDHDLPAGVGALYLARVERNGPPEDEDPNETMRRAVTEGLITLQKHIRSTPPSERGPKLPTKDV